jgi:hypothetical protein
VALFLVVSAVASTVVFGLMPALQATMNDPVRTLRGELVKDASPERVRTALIGVQVLAPTPLLICASIFLRSGMASSTYDPRHPRGRHGDDSAGQSAKRPALIQAIAAEPHHAMRGRWPDMMDMRSGFAAIGDAKTPLHRKFVSGEYFSVMGIPILRGRPFTHAERDGATVAIVGIHRANVVAGQSFRLEPDPPADAQPTGGGDGAPRD